QPPLAPLAGRGSARRLPGVGRHLLVGSSSAPPQTGSEWQPRSRDTCRASRPAESPRSTTSHSRDTAGVSCPCCSRAVLLLADYRSRRAGAGVSELLPVVTGGSPVVWITRTGEPPVTTDKTSPRTGYIRRAFSRLSRIREFPGLICAALSR